MTCFNQDLTCIMIYAAYVIIILNFLLHDIIHRKESHQMINTFLILITYLSHVNMSVSAIHEIKIITKIYELTVFLDTWSIPLWEPVLAHVQLFQADPRLCWCPK